ncbi:MAG: bifunctional DNA-formamidopyrimidine glycosylase/DNA-(apurinic or apyrimidinic site) lyase [Rhodospirillales bacterium]|nr:bifunctional DNA-formamidopyrimidine glycosylase/DNA-(apurinic or apyrimidinic site) lyase [Rhodospirillales bacterium]
MPELPEVETVCRGIAPYLEGRTLKTVVQRRPNLRKPFPEDFVTRLEGAKVITVRRRAKYIVIHTSSDDALLIHLGMSGRMTVYDPGEAPDPAAHDHVDFVTDQGHTLRFTDPRRFGLMDIVEGAKLDDHPLMAAIGPEPLGNQFNATVLAENLKKRNSPIKSVLLDQKVVAGLGNIYVCESLFRSGISPTRKALNLKTKEVERLWEKIVAVLNEAIAAGGSSLKDHRQASGELGYFQHNFKVYGREGEPCPGCDCNIESTGGIERITQSGRSTFFCAKKQR